MKSGSSLFSYVFHLTAEPQPALVHPDMPEKLRKQMTATFRWRLGDKALGLIVGWFFFTSILVLGLVVTGAALLPLLMPGIFGLSLVLVVGMIVLGLANSRARRRIAEHEDLLIVHPSDGHLEVLGMVATLNSEVAETANKRKRQCEVVGKGASVEANAGAQREFFDWATGYIAHG